LYSALRGHEGLGQGDLKFAAAAALWIGLEGIPGLLLAAVVSALASLLILRAHGYDLHGKLAISFGPHLALGLWLIWVFGPLQFGP
jgi:leader peptidase (prepilin peptidase) / N-methyltransferase